MEGCIVARIARVVTCVLVAALGSTSAAVAQEKRPWIADRDAWQKKDAEERAGIRAEIERAELDAVRASAKKPWRVKDSKEFLVLANCDRKYEKLATKVVDQFAAWCHEQFSDVTDEHVRRRVLTITPSESSDGITSTGYTSVDRGLRLDVDRPLIATRDKDYGNSAEQLNRVYRDVLDTYLMDKDAMLYRYMPAWLSYGLGEVTGSAYVKSKKLHFRAGDYERDELRLILRSDDVLSFRDILSLDQKTYATLNKGELSGRYQCVKAARFLIFGPGRKHKVTKTFLLDYMQAVIAAADALRKDWDPKALDQKIDGTDEEREALRKARTKLFHERRDAVTKLAFEKVCSGWTDKDWASVEKAFKKYEAK